MAVFLGVLSLFSIEAGPPMFNTTVPLGELNNHGHGVLITGMVVTFFIAWTLMIGNVMGYCAVFWSQRAHLTVDQNSIPGARALSADHHLPGRV